MVSASESIAPGYVKALDHVLREADTNIPLEQSYEDLETCLAHLAQLSAVFRGDDVYSILRQDESALIAGALSRSLVESALSERWYLSRNTSEKPRSATLARERQNITDAVLNSDLYVPNLSRWNNPIPDPLFASARPGPALPNVQADLSGTAPSSIERITALPAPIADVLGMCSHVNHAATWLTAAPGLREMGITASPPFAAVLAQSAGASLSSIRGFNTEQSHKDLVAESTRIHGLNLLPARGKEKIIEEARPARPATAASNWLENQPTQVMDTLLDELRSAAEAVWHLVNDAPNPFEGPNKAVNLTSALPYLTARGLLLLTLRSTYGNCSPFVAPTGARMLLEQGSEISWRFADTSDEELRARYVAHMDDATVRKQKLEQRLLLRTPSAAAVEVLLYPRGRKEFAVDRRRSSASQKPPRPPAPNLHLNALELGVSEPNWGPLAYKLLTQAVHATPLGLLHSVARTDTETGNPALSHEMTALSIDTACIGSALTFRALAPLICRQAGLPLPRPWLRQLFSAAANVHWRAQKLHFLG